MHTHWSSTRGTCISINVVFMLNLSSSYVMVISVLQCLYTATYDVTFVRYDCILA